MTNQQNKILHNSSEKQYFRTENAHGLIDNRGYASQELTIALNKVKAELHFNKKNLLIEEIKKTIIELVYYSEKQIKLNFSDYLSVKMNYHYTYLANLFSKVEGKSIQHFFIETKIDRVKELLVYEGMTLTEISYKLHYSSVAHLSNQFKKVTGLNPSKYLASVGQTKSLLPNTLTENIITYANYPVEEVFVSR